MFPLNKFVHLYGLKYTLKRHLIVNLAIGIWDIGAETNVPGLGASLQLGAGLMNSL